ncbi:MAG: ABC transporter ATP-binding protein, partial [Candidatus Eremiobacteraeota bacterium]|nr:ABC transporter ATP-binding protein [Candidatus Eremiobacteraeota bacterium]
MVDVALNSVSKAFGDVVAVQDLSLGIENGAFMVLLGPT